MTTVRQRLLLSLSIALIGCQPVSIQRDAAQLPADAALADAGASDRSSVDSARPDGAIAVDSARADGAVGIDSARPDTAVAVDSAARDAAVGSDSAHCVAVPDPTPVPGSPLPAESPAGRSETTSVDGFTDDYLYNATDYTKLGIRREWGGSIIFFGLAGSSGPGQNGSNVIDANDTGREVQVALYDPDRAMQNCAYNASCRSTPTSCANSITFLGWNPVQGGNRCNVGSGVISSSAAAGVLDVVTQPLHWNPNWDRSDCSDSLLRQRRSEVTVRQRARFINQHVVELDYTVDNPGDLGHAATGQEFPTVYTANGQQGPDLWRLYDSSLTQIAIDQPGNDGFFYKNFDSAGGWVSLQNESSDYGVGMYYENRLTGFQGWQNRSLPFNNFRAQFAFAIPAHAAVRARAYLILGGLSTVAAEAAALDQQLPPFGWLDQPAADQQLTGSATVVGWALDNKGVTGVELWVDGALQSALAYGGARPDVCLVWPGYRGCDQVGFSGTLDTALLAPCQHLIEIQASDADGNQRVIARRRVAVVR